MAPSHNACLKSMSVTITMQGLTLTAITATEKHTLMLDLTKNHDKVTGVQNLSQGHGVTMYCACLKIMSRPITMQGFTLTASSLQSNLL